MAAPEDRLPVLEPGELYDFDVERQHMAIDHLLARVAAMRSAERWTVWNVYATDAIFLERLIMDWDLFVFTHAVTPGMQTRLSSMRAPSKIRDLLVAPPVVVGRSKRVILRTVNPVSAAQTIYGEQFVRAKRIIGDWLFREVIKFLSELEPLFRHLDRPEDEVRASLLAVGQEHATDRQREIDARDVEEMAGGMMVDMELNFTSEERGQQPETREQSRVATEFLRLDEERWRLQINAEERARREAEEEAPGGV
jgi:hypothetical protein